jgi:hypothetical protein
MVGEELLVLWVRLRCFCETDDTTQSLFLGYRKYLWTGRVHTYVQCNETHHDDRSVRPFRFPDLPPDLHRQHDEPHHKIDQLHLLVTLAFLDIVNIFALLQTVPFLDGRRILDGRVLY